MDGSTATMLLFLPTIPMSLKAAPALPVVTPTIITSSIPANEDNANPMDILTRAINTPLPASPKNGKVATRLNTSNVSLPINNPTDDQSADPLDVLTRASNTPLPLTPSRLAIPTNGLTISLSVDNPAILESFPPFVPNPDKLRRVRLHFIRHGQVRLTHSS
jgi:hypothetical protein